MPSFPNRRVARTATTKRSMAATRAAIEQFIKDFDGRSKLELREHRREKFLAIGSNLS